MIKLKKLSYVQGTHMNCLAGSEEKWFLWFADWVECQLATKILALIFQDFFLERHTSNFTYLYILIVYTVTEFTVFQLLNMDYCSYILFNNSILKEYSILKKNPLWLFSHLPHLVSHCIGSICPRGYF